MAGRMAQVLTPSRAQSAMPKTTTQRVARPRMGRLPRMGHRRVHQRRPGALGPSTWRAEALPAKATVASPAPGAHQKPFEREVGSGDLERVRHRRLQQSRRHLASGTGRKSPSAPRRGLQRRWRRQHQRHGSSSPMPRRALAAQLRAQERARAAGQVPRGAQIGRARPRHRSLARPQRRRWLGLAAQAGQSGGGGAQPSRRSSLRAGGCPHPSQAPAPPAPAVRGAAWTLEKLLAVTWPGPASKCARLQRRLSVHVNPALRCGNQRVNVLSGRLVNEYGMNAMLRELHQARQVKTADEIGPWGVSYRSLFHPAGSQARRR